MTGETESSAQAEGAGPQAQAHSAKEARRAQLLATALSLFAEKGYHATSIADIIEKAQVARGTFYNYFESKRQIFEKLLDQLFDTATRSVKPITTDNLEGVPAQVRENLIALFGSLMDNLAVTRVLLEQAVGLDAEASQQLKRFYGRVLARLQTAIEKGQAMGVVRAGNAQVLAVCILGMIKESLYQRLLGTASPDLDGLVDEIFTTTARGILGDGR